MKAGAPFGLSLLLGALLLLLIFWQLHRLVLSPIGGDPATAIDVVQRIAAGDLAVVFDWLKAHVWQQASRWTTDELARRASGETLNPAHFKAHLEARYLG